ncbi:MAG: hypothetical protein V3T01_05850 [Myxococcota bacterium]
MRRAALWVLLAASVVVFLSESGVRHSQLDDAYISYRYAENLVSGMGLVYNPGERVEGITNLLWALLVAVGIALGFEGNIVGHALGLVSGTALLVATTFYARTLVGAAASWLAGVAAWIVVSSVVFVLWATSGMETALFAAATTAALAAQAGGRLGWATLGALVATLTRPDGVLVAAVIFGFHLVSRWREGRRAWTWPAIYVASVGLLTGFRIAYYGSVVPNTFYAKVGGIPIERGLTYLMDFLGTGAVLLLVPAAIAVVRDRRCWPGAAFCAVQALYVVSVGGDAFPASRFLLPVLACMAALAVRGAATAHNLDPYAGILVFLQLPMAIAWNIFGTLPGPIVFGFAISAIGAAVGVALGRRWIGVAGLAAVAVVGGGLAWMNPEAVRDAARVSRLNQDLKRVRRSFGVLERMGFMRAQVLRERGDPIRLVAGGAIGSFGFYSRLPIIDLYGLVDVEIARSRGKVDADAVLLPGHQRSDAGRIFARQPDYILMPKPGTGISERLPANLEIAAHPALKADYVWDPEVWGFRRNRR